MQNRNHLSISKPNTFIIFVVIYICGILYFAGAGIGWLLIGERVDAIAANQQYANKFIGFSCFLTVCRRDTSNFGGVEQRNSTINTSLTERNQRWAPSNTEAETRIAITIP